jgi:hypothetical protein
MSAGLFRLAGPVARAVRLPPVALRRLGWVHVTDDWPAGGQALVLSDGQRYQLRATAQLALAAEPEDGRLWHPGRTQV